MSSTDAVVPISPLCLAMSRVCSAFSFLKQEMSRPPGPEHILHRCNHLAAHLHTKSCLFHELVLFPHVMNTMPRSIHFRHFLLCLETAIFHPSQIIDPFVFRIQKFVLKASAEQQASSGKLMVNKVSNAKSNINFTYNVILQTHYEAIRYIKKLPLIYSTFKKLKLLHSTGHLFLSLICFSCISPALLVLLWQVNPIDIFSCNIIQILFACRDL